MGLFDKIFGHAPTPPKKAKSGPINFQTLTAYSPRLISYNGQIWDTEIVRASVDAIARACGKLSVTFGGTAKPSMQKKMRTGPNEWQTWSQFLYRLSAILHIENTAFIVPVFDEFGEVSGFFPILPSHSELVEYDSTPYIRYTFSNGKKAAIELSRVGIMTRHQFRDDFFGDSNGALIPTMELINVQNQGIKEAVKNSNTFRFMATYATVLSDEDLAEERSRFTRANLESGGGFLLFPNDYKDVKQIESKPYTVDSAGMEQIRNSTFDYFGVNEKILQNKAYGNEWAAFYEGAIEPFAIQFSDVMTRMMFSERERANGNYVMATANRLQFMTASEKLNVSEKMLDRGILSRNEAREIWNLPPIEGGDEYIVRGEYYNADDKLTSEPGGDEGGEGNAD